MDSNINDVKVLIKKKGKLSFVLPSDIANYLLFIKF